jgi:radical SAM protein with 4Fe4S-binding SPASM domain
MDDLSLVKIKQFLDRFPNTEMIIINGGDPLMMNPDYYQEILEYLELKGMTKCKISFTTNLWDWWLHPEKWENIFSHNQVRVTTSFQYGSGRMINSKEILTEKIFLEIITKFKAKYSYTPDFIVVISNENKEKTLDHVRLAKYLDIECKVNYAMASGREGINFPIGEMYNLYLDIYEEGLAEWEYSTKQMLKKLKGNETTSCPLNRSCDGGIRNLQPTSETGYNYGSCGAFGDDQEYGIDFEKEMSGDFFTPLRSQKELAYLKEECLSCPMFNICNGCYKTIRDLKQNNLVEYSCDQMKKAKARADKLNLS